MTVAAAFVPATPGSNPRSREVALARQCTRRPGAAVARHLVVARAKRGRGFGRNADPPEDVGIEQGRVDASVDSSSGAVDRERLAAELKGEKMDADGARDVQAKVWDDMRQRAVDPEQATTLPQKVADRMLNRMLWLCGVPMTLGITFFAASFILSYRFEIRFIPIYVAYATLGSFFTGLVGLTYGIMSSSWDAEIEGSFWGFKEAKRNVLLVKDGLLNQKTREDEDNKWGG